MSIGSEIRDEVHLAGLSAGRPLNFSSPVVPCVLALADAVTIILSGLAHKVGYKLVAGNALPVIAPYFALGLLAIILYVSFVNRKGYYVFPDSAKRGVEINDILTCWV